MTMHKELQQRDDIDNLLHDISTNKLAKFLMRRPGHGYEKETFKAQQNLL